MFNLCRASPIAYKRENLAKNMLKGHQAESFT